MLINHKVYNCTMLMEVENDNIGYDQRKMCIRDRLWCIPALLGCLVAWAIWAIYKRLKR